MGLRVRSGIYSSDQRRMKKLCRRMAVFVCALGTVLFLMNLIQNSNIEVSRFTIKSSRIPIEFNGYRIAQISDLHNAQFGRDNCDLINILKKEKPDLIVVTGDLIDSDKMEVSVSLMCRISHIAPCYYVNGNHEAEIGKTYRVLEEKLKKMGVHVLCNQNQKITKGSGEIWITGLEDPDFTENRKRSSEMTVDQNLKKLKPYKNEYQIVLSHRPEIFQVYVRNKCDLVFTGHSHGGQIRLPGIGAVAAPDQGLFPVYDQGIFRQDQTAMIVSRGLGTSVVPIRLNCRPEIVIADLRAED